MTVFALTETQTEIVNRTLPNGDTVPVHITSIRGQKISEVQVNDEGLFDGTGVAWHMSNGGKSNQGQWKDGYWHGEWHFYDPQGELSEIVEFDMGKPIRCEKLVDGQMQEIPPKEWSRVRQMVKQRSPQGIKQYPVRR